MPFYESLDTNRPIQVLGRIAVLKDRLPNDRRRLRARQGDADTRPMAARWACAENERADRWHVERVLTWRSTCTEDSCSRALRRGKRWPRGPRRAGHEANGPTRFGLGAMMSALGRRVTTPRTLQFARVAYEGGNLTARPASRQKEAPRDGAQSDLVDFVQDWREFSRRESAHGLSANVT